MGGALNHITDPFGFIPDKLQELDVISRLPVEKLLDGLSAGTPSPEHQIEPAVIAGGAAGTDPAASAYNRTRSAAPSAEQQGLDRRRSIASAMRRRNRSSSILTTGTTPALSDSLGGA